MKTRKGLLRFVLVLAVAVGLFGSVSVFAANTTYDSATTISVNASVTDNLAERDDVNWYKFTLSGAGYIYLSFTHDYVESSYAYWGAYIYDASQNELANYEFDGDTTTYTQGKIGLPAGTYYIKVYQPSYSKYDDGDYVLKVNYTSSSAWETELNDTYSDADKISTGSSVKGSFMYRDDKDWYKFTLSSAGYIYLSFTHDYVESSYAYWGAYLYDSSFNELADYEFDGDTTSYTQGKIGLPAGTYYIKVYQPSYSKYDDGDYALKVKYTSSSAWETELNDTYSAADKISVGSAVSGSFMYRDDVDWYKFTLSSKKSIAFKFTHEYVEDSSDYWGAYIYSSDMSELYNFTYSGSTKSSIEYFTLSAGTYYIKVYQPSYSKYDDGKYSLKVMARKSLSSATVTLSKTTYTYSGSARKPSVTVTLGSTTLTKGTDYKVTYKSNKSIGTATVTIKGIGAYKGSVSATYKIKPKQATISSAKSSSSKKITVKWKKVSGSVTKYQIRYRYKTSSGYSSWKKVTVSSSTLKKTLTGLKSGKKYQIQVRAYKTVSGKNYIGSWSKTKTVTVK